MILKHACLLSLPLLAVDAKRSQVLHSSGRRRREARRAKHALKASAGEQEEEACNAHGKHCWIDRNCCGEMECLGVVHWECGYTPGHEDEYCNVMYPCEPDLACFEGDCTDYADILDRGDYEGTCKEGSPPGELTVMTYNTFLLSCATGLGPGLDIPCQHTDEKKERIGRMMEWVKTRDEDVVVFQELFNLKEDIKAGMVAAGFCHYVVTPYGDDGDGTATFSKYPIGEVDFWDYYDFVGEDGVKPPLQAEAYMTDRGIMYAEILKDGRSHHVHNTHTLSNSVTEEHERRMAQYLAMREVGALRSAGDLVLYAGDMNENKYNTHVGDAYYQDMLKELDATEPRHEGDQQFSYDNVKNPLPAIWYPPEKKVYQELLDFVLISNAHLQPSDASCRILTPQWPEECDGSVGCQVSDHFPVTCTYSFDGVSIAVE